MSKIYVFGIGGTGSRVLRSLTMLLAAGVECKADTIVPIVIDSDSAGGDVERTATLMRHYGEIRKKLDFGKHLENQFFRTEIREITSNYHLPLSNVEDCLFEDYIEYPSMKRENQALVNVLFSQQNLHADMQVGFKGNPNIGSVVLNQFEDSEIFQNFANEFTADDKIFIISSIFGGTGASGFPLLLKTLRENRDIPNQNLVNNAHIGAVTVLPYFKVRQDDSSAIDSATFVSKAKSALAYYYRSISQNHTIDNLYYIGDDTRSTTYKNCEGGINQKNNAHFVEMAAALSIIDFANTEKPIETRHKEFGIEKDVNEIIFDILGPRTNSQVRRGMTQFMLFAKYMDEAGDYLRQPWSKDRQLDSTFFNSDFIRNLKRNILDQYRHWLAEMDAQDRKFTPFTFPYSYDRNDEIVVEKGRTDRVFDLVKGVKPRKLFTTDSNYYLFDNRLNGTRGNSRSGSKEQQFMELFYLATKRLANEKLNIN